jgi:glutathione S-transferase
MKLYDAELSGNCHRVRLLLALLGQPYEKVTVNMRAGENRTPQYLALNPRGQVPVLTDGDFTVWDSQAILVYLAGAYGSEQWLPTEAKGMAEVMQWMAVSENEVLYGLARARVMQKFGVPGDVEACREMGRKILDVMNAHLATRDWLACARLTIADVACFPYVALAPEGGVALTAYPNVGRWIDRIKALPGYVGMPGI